MDSQGMKNAKKMLEKFGWSEGDLFIKFCFA